MRRIEVSEITREKNYTRALPIKPWHMQLPVIMEITDGNHLGVGNHRFSGHSTNAECPAIEFLGAIQGMLSVLNFHSFQ